tara:strand:- start:7146 stop:7529 length:384 start_codon:yes stop_codon:yes gene_type:complete
MISYTRYLISNTKNPQKVSPYLILKLFTLCKLLFCLTFFNGLRAESFPEKLGYIDKLRDCLSDVGFFRCQKLILQLEKIQLEEYKNKNFKCQTSILGAQTHLINKFYFRESKKYSSNQIISNVIKNC